MPQIDQAMIVSRTQSLWTRTEPLMPRATSVASSVASVKDTFSSWGNCMEKGYCKWPVIAIIIIGGLIVLSVVWCIARCACCGLSCCCTCFSCLKCCGECCGMCDGRKSKAHKHIDEPFKPQPFQQPSPYTGYQAPKPMGYEAPQYATFETGKSGLAVDTPKAHEDALPAMPVWDNASTMRIPTEDQKEVGMELGNLTPHGQNMPLMSGASGAGASTPGATSPMNDPSPGYFSGRGGPGQNGYMQGQPGGNMPYGPGGMSRTGSPAMMNGRGGAGGMNGPGMAGPGMGPPRMNSPGMGPPPRMNSPGMGPPRMNSPGYGGPNNRGNIATGSGPPRDQYGQPTSPQTYNNQRPGFPPTAGYRGPPQRQYSNDSYGRNQPQQPQRQYSNDPGAPSPNGRPQRQLTVNDGFSQPGPQRGYSSDTYRPSQDMHRPPASPSSPLNNSGGFDFNLGGPSRYEMPAQPQQQPHFDVSDHSDYAPSTAAPTYTSRAEPSQQLQQRRYSPSSPSNEFHYDQQRSYSPQAQEVHEMSSSEAIASRADGSRAYPGYKAYSPAPPGASRRTPPPPNALMPGRPNY